MELALAERQLLKEILGEHPFLQGIKPDYVDFLAECATTKHFEAGDYMLYERQKADQFFLIHEGKVVLGASNPGRSFTTIQTLTDGDILGWSWIAPPYRWHFNARVAQPTLAVVMEGEDLRQKCEADHEFGYELLQRLMPIIWERLRLTRRRL